MKKKIRAEARKAHLLTKACMCWFYIMYRFREARKKGGMVSL